MPITHHPTIEEFAEYKETIHDLKPNNVYFRWLAHEYDGIDKPIFRAERGIEIVNDDYLDSIKKGRLHLKDMVYSMPGNQAITSKRA